MPTGNNLEIDVILNITIVTVKQTRTDQYMSNMPNVFIAAHHIVQFVPYLFKCFIIYLPLALNFYISGYCYFWESLDNLRLVFGKAAVAEVPEIKNKKIDFLMTLFFLFLPDFVAIILSDMKLFLT